MIPVIFVIPLVQMILLTYAASLEMKGIKMAGGGPGLFPGFAVAGFFISGLSLFRDHLFRQ